MGFRPFGTPFGGRGFGRPFGRGGGGSAPPTKAQILDAYLLTLSPTILLKYNEPSGDTINYGSDGGIGTPANVTYGVAGLLDTCYSFNATTSIITFLNATLAASKNLTTQRWMFLVKPNGLGEGNTGRFFNWNGDPQATNLLFRTTNRMQATVNTDTVDAGVVTNFNQADNILAGNWALVFMDYDNADSLGLGRKIRLFYATAAIATTLMTEATDTAGTGIASPHAGTLTIGNDSTIGTTFDGLKNRLFLGNGLWSPAATPADLTLPNAIRTLVF